MKKNQKTIIATVCLVAVILVLGAIYFLTKPGTQQGNKSITIEVIHKDSSSKEFVCSTSAEYLGEVLKTEEIVEGEDGPYGLYITAADGETADESNQEWWCITKGGEQVNTSADETPIADQDHFEITLTVGY
ncbi:MAG: DUF4430 domain-containing protein [Lachnospiraceae bacterium]|jgi:hypothetical protein